MNKTTEKSEMREREIKDKKKTEDGDGEDREED